MTIQQRSFLSIVPIFIFMSIFIGTLKYITSKGEMKNFLESETKAFLVSIQQFLNPKEARQMIELSKMTNYYKKSFKIIEEQNRIKKVFIMYWNEPSSMFSLIGNTNLSDLQLDSKDYDKIISHSSQFHISDIIIEDKFLYSDKFQSHKSTSKLYVYYSLFLEYLNINQENYKYYRYAYMKLEAKEHTKEDILVGIKVDVTQYSNDINSLLWGIILQILFIGILAGIFTSFFISKIITRKINIFIKEGNEAVNGNYKKNINIEFIQEVKDLSNTFNTMNSFLDEKLSHTQQEFITSEQFRILPELSEQYNSMIWKPVHYKKNGIEITGEFIGDHVKGSFLDVLDFKEHIYIILGRLRMEESNLYSSIEACSLLEVIKNSLPGNKDISLLLYEVQKYFDIQKLMCISLRLEDFYLTEYIQEHTKGIYSNSYTLEKNCIYPFHVMQQAQIDAITKTYFQVHKNKSTQEILCKMKHALEVKNNGVIALLKKTIV